MGILTLRFALLFRLLVGEILREGGALLRKLLPVGLQAVRTGQLQKLLPQLGGVSLWKYKSREISTMLWEKTIHQHQGLRMGLTRGGVFT